MDILAKLLNKNKELMKFISSTLSINKIFLIIFLINNILYSQNKKQHLDSLLTAEYNKDNFNGNILISEKGNIIYKKSFGQANEFNKINLNTTFELASVSKQFTALGIILLKNENKLSIDDKLVKYIPELSVYNNITIRNLLNQTSGLDDYLEIFDKYWDKTEIATNDDLIRLFKEYEPKVLFQPNEKFHYSNTNYALLATIIERVSEKSLNDYLTAKIFKPLEMNNTFISVNNQKGLYNKNYARGYTIDSLAQKVLINSNDKQYYANYLSGIVGSALVHSNVNDLLKYDRALYTDEIISPIDKKNIFGIIQTNNSEKSNYGFGWFINENNEADKVAYHSGNWNGFISYFERNLTKDKTIIILQNSENILSRNLISNIRNVLNDQKIISKEILLKETDIKEFKGSYFNYENSLEITIFNKDNLLFARAKGQNAFLITPINKKKFVFEPAEISIEFNAENNHIEYVQGDFKTKLIKL